MSGNLTNLICNRTILTRDQEMYFQNYTWWIETVGNLCCGSIGLFLNSVTIHVFSSAANFSKKTFFHRLLICLAIFDTLYIVCEISEVFRHRYNTFYQLEIFVNFVYPIRNIFMLSSVSKFLAQAALDICCLIKLDWRPSVKPRVDYYNQENIDICRSEMVANINCKTIDPAFDMV